MFSDDDLLPISALQHLVFCRRQWALIHLEGQWAENRLTVQGRHLHERAHKGGCESRGDVRITRGLRLCSYRLGLTGQADVVEFHRAAGNDASGVCGVSLPGVEGLWRPFPVEYKRGRPKGDDCDEVQLCAQALCLEEMLDTSVPAGALFYGQPRRRHDVPFTETLRGRVESLAATLHDLTVAGATPPARYEKKCRNCSLANICMPKVAGGRRASQYVADLLANLEDGAPSTDP